MHSVYLTMNATMSMCLWAQSVTCFFLSIPQAVCHDNHTVFLSFIYFNLFQPTSRANTHSDNISCLPSYRAAQLMQSPIHTLLQTTQSPTFATQQALQACQTYSISSRQFLYQTCFSITQSRLLQQKQLLNHPNFAQF